MFELGQVVRERILMSGSKKTAAVIGAGFGGLALAIRLQSAGIQTTPLSHAEVIEAGQQAEPVISALLARIVAEL